MRSSPRKRETATLSPAMEAICGSGHPSELGHAPLRASKTVSAFARHAPHPLWKGSKTVDCSRRKQLEAERETLAKRGLDKMALRSDAAFSHGAILLVDPHRPNVLVSAKLLETQGRVAGIGQKQPIGAARGLASTGIQPIVSAPEAGPGAGFHRRCGSSGSSGSAADSRRKASSFGRGQDRPAVVPIARRLAGREGNGQSRRPRFASPVAAPRRRE